MLINILIATLAGSIFSLLGGVVLLWRSEFAKKFSLVLVSFAAGSLIGAAFFELIPESIEDAGYDSLAAFLVLGILVFFFLEKVLKWYHCHDQSVCDYHTFSSTVLFGDALHNFVDGVAIALSFSVSTAAGISTAIAVFFHEIPQEIGDFGVLLHAGWKRSRVLLYNFFSALTAIAGAVIGYFLLPWIGPFLGIFLAFIAGSFIYIAVSDLLPELRHKGQSADILHIVSILLGVLVVWGVGTILPE